METSTGKVLSEFTDREKKVDVICVTFVFEGISDRMEGPPELPGATKGTGGNLGWEGSELEELGAAGLI